MSKTQKMDYDLVEEEKNAIDLNMQAIISSVTNMKTLFSDIFASDYWLGKKSELCEESLNAFWAKGPDSQNVIDKLETDRTSMIAFINEAISKTKAADEASEFKGEVFATATGVVGLAKQVLGIFDEVPDDSPAGSSATQTVNEASSSTNTTKSNSNSASMSIPSGKTNFKGYTKYTSVTNKSTPQYAVLNGLTSPYGKFKGTTYNTKTDESSGVRYVTFEGDTRKYYCAALGTYYGEVGDTFTITTDEGNTFNVIMCDAKGAASTKHENGSTWYHDKGDSGKEIIEFYIEYPSDEIKVYDRSGKYKGTTGNYEYCDQFSGNVTSVVKLS